MSSDDDSLFSFRTSADKPVWFDVGIYPAEGFVLFQVGLFEISRAYPGKQITVFHLHIWYFHLDFGLVTNGTF